MDFVKSEHLVYDYKTYNEHSEIVTNRAVDGLDIAIPKGQFIAVLGHNGSGKSTFAKHINALLLPTEGKREVNRLDTKDEKKFLLHLCSGGFYNHPCKDKAVLTAEGRWESFRIELCSVGLYI